MTDSRSATDAQRLKALSEELRCVVCQNQTLADSNAKLAEDLRDEVREQIALGRSDEQIKIFLVERYGDFVLYKPPLKASTLALWAGPFALLAVGAGAWWLVQRRQRLRSAAPAAGTASAAGAEGKREKARRLLD